MEFSVELDLCLDALIVTLKCHLGEHNTELVLSGV